VTSRSRRGKRPGRSSPRRRHGPRRGRRRRDRGSESGLSRPTPVSNRLPGCMGDRFPGRRGDRLVEAVGQAVQDRVQPVDLVGQRLAGAILQCRCCHAVLLPKGTGPEPSRASRAPARARPGPTARPGVSNRRAPRPRAGPPRWQRRAATRRPERGRQAAPGAGAAAASSSPQKRPQLSWNARRS
jgi:hypothetical protein